MSHNPFLWRRLHSLMGLWLVLFLIEHLLTNSQAALWIGEDGRGFVEMVNAIHNLPYLQLFEALLLGIPILIHLVWGVRYALTAKSNTRATDGSTPHLPLPRNRAYRWQRITSWVLLFGLLFHVTKFRFLDYPEQVTLLGKTSYLIPLNVDAGLYSVADRLQVSLYDTESIARAETAASSLYNQEVLEQATHVMSEQHYSLLEGPIPQPYRQETALLVNAAEKYESAATLARALKRHPLSQDQVLCLAPDFGTASLLSVREAFKNPLYVGGYTLFVLAACFHACNGFWTFLLTWGLVLKASAQKTWAGITTCLMLLLLFLGLAAIWGTYWVNLK